MESPKAEVDSNLPFDVALNEYDFLGRAGKKKSPDLSQQENILNNFSESNLELNKPLQQNQFYDRKKYPAKGRCLILDFRSCPNLSLIKSTFDKLDFDVEVHRNLSVSETLKLLRKESKRPENNDIPHLVLYVVTKHTLDYKNLNQFNCRDGYVCIELVMDQMTMAKEKGPLAGKPKLLLIESINYLDSPVTLVTDSPNETSRLIPRHSDWLIFYLRFSGFKRLNSTETVCQALSRYCPQMNVLQVFTQITGLIDRLSGEKTNECVGKASATTFSTLTRLLHFEPLPT